MLELSIAALPRRRPPANQQSSASATLTDASNFLRMAALPNYVEPFRHLRFQNGRVWLSVCNDCGLLVAASPRESALQLAEHIHTCPVYLNYLKLA
jgi:hypothetical protein